MIKLQTARINLGFVRDNASLFSRGRRALSNLHDAARIPSVGEKPQGLRVSNRAWRRNSALVMALYEKHGHVR